MIQRRNIVSKYKFIVVSNRLPVTVKKENGTLQFSESSGGLATAMSSLGNTEESLWIGWPGIVSEELTSADKITISKKLKKYNCVPVYLNAELVASFYEGYANDTLWPLFHYFQESAKHNEEYWQAYKCANELFAKAVVKCADPQATIWVHDYHFLILPGMLRAQLPGASIGFFLHIPFPSYEIFRLLPERREILEGMLGADLLGFHIYDYARHFLSSCLRMLGVKSNYGMLEYKGRTMLTDAFPIGIDYAKFRKLLHTKVVTNEVEKIKETYQKQKIIISVDRLDYTKGIMQRLQAYDVLLRENPKLHKNIVLVMVAVPSRTEVQTYKELRDTIEQTIGRINGEYGTVDWSPISYQFKNLPLPQVVGLYASADVALVTPLRDGMNLVAKEYVASKTDNGVLILSELAGAIDELPEAIKVNPNDIRSIKDAITQALSMTAKEKRQRLASMQQRIAMYTVQRWAEDFLEQLIEIKKYQLKQYKKIIDNQTVRDITKSFKAAKRRLLILDYDGTIRDFVSSPDPVKAKPSIVLKRMLRAIAEKDNTKVCIVSGRSRVALESWFGNMPVVLVAEHGAWTKYDKEWKNVTTNFVDYKEIILELLLQYAERTAGAEIEEKDFSIVWHYRNVPTELAYVRNLNLKRDLQTVLAGTDAQVYSGEKIIEIKPRSISKGFVAEDIVKDFEPDFILCAGDDYTDEDMFQVLPENAFTIKVGPGYSDAHYQVPDVQSLVRILQQMM